MRSVEVSRRRMIGHLNDCVNLNHSAGLKRPFVRPRANRDRRTGPTGRARWGRAKHRRPWRGSERAQRAGAGREAASRRPPPTVRRRDAHAHHAFTPCVDDGDRRSGTAADEVGGAAGPGRVRGHRAGRSNEGDRDRSRAVPARHVVMRCIADRDGVPARRAASVRMGGAGAAGGLRAAGGPRAVSSSARGTWRRRVVVGARGPFGAARGIVARAGPSSTRRSTCASRS